MNQELLGIFYFQTVDLWQKLCEAHNELYSLTCQEYGQLLSNNIDELEKTVAQKQYQIHSINGLEDLRQELITDINKFNEGEELKNVSDLLKIMSATENEKDQKHLLRFNKLLIDIIEKIQDQNKRNQLFINKALISLREIRQEILGNKKFMTYNSVGATNLR